MCMKRFPIWLACVLTAILAIPTTAFAQARRPNPARVREEHREVRREERHEAAREHRENVREHNERVRERREDIRERQWREVGIRRERLILDRRARERRDIALWRRLRIERALAHRREIYGRWAWAVATPEGRAEFVLYSDRMARLHRIRDIGEDRRDNTLVVRVDRVIALENARHANVIAVIIAKRPL